MPEQFGTEQRRWQKTAKRQGWTVHITEDQHLIFISPDGEQSVTVPGREAKGRTRSIQNNRAALRRAGLSI